jgi:hypothetical protein
MEEIRSWHSLFSGSHPLFIYETQVERFSVHSSQLMIPKKRPAKRSDRHYDANAVSPNG